MKKGETRQVIRWGDYSKDDLFTLCFRAYSRGATSLDMQMRKVYRDYEDGKWTDFPTRPWKIYIYWVYPITMNRKQIILDGQSYLVRHYKTKSVAKKAFMKLKWEREKAKAEWRVFQDRDYSKLGDIIKP